MRLGFQHQKILGAQLAGTWWDKGDTDPHTPALCVRIHPGFLALRFTGASGLYLYARTTLENRVILF